MPDTPIWEVILYVDGPVTVRGRVTSTQQKGFRVEDPFYSDIEIMGIPTGLKATVTARAPNQGIAYKAAVFFFGHMVDALTFTINQPLHLSFMQGERNSRPRHDVKRRIEQQEFEDAFREAHFLGQGSPSFMRSLGWYRKGLTADDPFDKFLAFWNAIEVVASKYYRYVPTIDKTRAERSKGQVWECFKALWGPCDIWPVIPGQSDWIDKSYGVRVGVAHGSESIDIHKVAEVVEQIPAIEEVSYGFLTGWRHRFLDLNRNPPSEDLPAEEQELLPEL